MSAVLPLATTWTLAEVNASFAVPFNDLVFQAQTVHRQFFKPNAETRDISTLLLINAGACAEDCKYCPQSGYLQYRP